MGILNKLIKRLFGRSSACEIDESETTSPKQITDPTSPSWISNNNTKESICYVDLGLPSGTLWADGDMCGVNIPADCFLPTYAQASEFVEYCEFQTLIFPTKDMEYIKCCQVLGPNGNSILFRMQKYDQFPFPVAARWCKDGPGEGWSYVLLMSEFNISIGVAQNENPYPSRMVRI